MFPARCDEELNTGRATIVPVTAGLSPLLKLRQNPGGVAGRLPLPPLTLQQGPELLTTPWDASLCRRKASMRAHNCSDPPDWALCWKRSEAASLGVRKWHPRTDWLTSQGPDGWLPCDGEEGLGSAKLKEAF